MADANKFDHELLLAAVEGELTAAQRKQVEQLIAEDSRVGNLLEAMRADRQALRAAPDPPAPHWLMDEVDRQLERDMLVGSGAVDRHVDAVRDAHVFRRLMVYGAVAAMLAIVATVILSSLTVPTHDPIEPVGPVAGDPTPDPVGPDSPIDPVTPDPVTPDPRTVVDSGDPITPDPIIPNVPTMANKPGPISIDDALASAADAARDPDLLAKLVIGEGDPASATGPAIADSSTPRVIDRDDFPAPLSQPGPGGRIKDLIEDPSLPGPAPRDPVVPNDPITSPGDVIDSPDDAPRIDAATRPVFNVTDRDATLQRIDRLAELRGGARVPGASDAPGTVVYQLDADQLDAFVGALSTVVGESETLTFDRAASTKPKLDDSPWPSLVPDYLSILDQQLPGDDKPAAAKVKLPIKVMQGASE